MHITILFEEDTNLAYYKVYISTKVYFTIMETDTIQIPRKIVEEIYDTHEKIDQILETLEVLMDEETLKRLKKGEEELKTGDYIDAKPEEIAELLR